MSRLLLTAALMAASLLWPHAMTARAETVLRLSTWVPPNHELNRTIFSTWGRSVERVSQGRVRVSIEHNLAPPNRQFDLIREGKADIGYVFHGYHPERFMLPYLMELPGTGVDPVAASVAYWRVHQAHLAKADEHHGVAVIAVMLHGAGVLHLKTPITQIGDLRGRKIRVPGGVSEEIARALGIVPVNLAPTQAYAALVDGRVEGAFLPMESKESFRLQEVARYSVTMPGGFYDGTFAIVMNPNSLERLGSDREAFLSVSGERLSALAGRGWRTAEARAHAVAEAAGNIITTGDAAMQFEFERLFGPIEAAWIVKASRERRIDARRVLAEYRQIARTYSE